MSFRGSLGFSEDILCLKNKKKRKYRNLSREKGLKNKISVKKGEKSQRK